VLGEPKKRILPREEVRLIVSLALIAVKFIAISLARTEGKTMAEGEVNFIGYNAHLRAEMQAVSKAMSSMEILWPALKFAIVRIIVL